MKIVTIGAGSVVWGPTINIDFLLNPALDGAELTLMDVNPESLGLVERLLNRLIDERGFDKTITATTDVREALTDANYALTAISVGGDRLWRYDSIFPQIYDVFQPVGDTIGPGGLVRALRHAPPLLEMGRTLRDVGAPGATLIQLTNPMNPLCDALGTIEGITVYGVCHGVDDTARLIAERLGVPRDEVDVQAAGNNHNIFCTEIRVGDEVYDQARFAELTPQIFETPFRAEVWKRYGGLVGNHARHPIEFLPGFLTVEHEFGRKWGVRPIAQEIDPMLGSRQDRSRELLARALAQPDPIAWREGRGGGGLRVNDAGRVETGHSREGLDGFIVALTQGGDFFIHLNVPNETTIEGVSPEYNVEVPVWFENGREVRKPIRFNEAIMAEIERVGKEQHLLAQACLDPDEDLLVKSLAMDALVPSREVATRLVREMTEYQRDYIPALAARAA